MIWHAGMYIKLIKEGVTGKILNVAYQLYQNVKSCVELNGKKSDYFCCNIGVHQGDSLSPLLFAIFVNDLESYLLQEGNNYLSFGGDARLENMLKLLILMYADDTVTLADSPDKLQAAINRMEKYCEKRKLKSQCKYLGVPFTSNCKFTECRKYVVNQARKAIYLILKKARIQKLPIDVQLDLFHNMVLPILIYSSEVWGIENNDLIIKLHVKFCKHILHCKTSTPTCMVYEEPGQIPPSIEIKCRIFNYWASMLTNPDKLSSRVYNVSLMLYNNNDYKSPWLTYVENTLNVNGLVFYWLTQAVDNIDSFMYIVKTQPTDQFKQEWYSDIKTLML